MNHLFSQYWWLFVLRGVFAIILGLIALFAPGAAFATLILFLGVFLFVDGIFSVVSAISSRRTNPDWGWLLFSGITGIVVGIIMFYHPFATAAALIYFIAFWTLVAGIAEIAIAIRLRKSITGEGWYIFGGILTILFGILLLRNPFVGILSIMIIFAIYAIMFGVMLISLGMRLRKRYKQHPTI
ncbi:HdeD family acid-resistance protein [Danxiaibacter flavus]|uniref:HdeD family acid-resistance protein n=1 Tax=Danxiaibacter flavus TaxID=3049108 RepID=A0ABV3ZGY9_9BACT|nr:HdeD family acid-resistance protein [Chitinophagaceae bacterium DXS]